MIVIRYLFELALNVGASQIRCHDDNRIFEFLPYNMIQLIHQECGLYDPKKNEEFIYQMEHIPTYWRLRLVVDWIAGMTDKYALETYQRLSGMKLT